MPILKKNKEVKNILWYLNLLKMKIKKKKKLLMI